jgi:two-component system C4-dicarboxylate transport response regulator DctD
MRVRIGKFEHAQGGTLFLDEIERIGSNKAIPIDCRVIAAAKEDLKALSDRQKFRADLYCRIGVADRFVLGLLGDSLNLATGSPALTSSLPEQVEHFERTLITEELRRHHGDVAHTSKALGLPKQTLYDKLRRLRISTDEFRHDS